MNQELKEYWQEVDSLSQRTMRKFIDELGAIPDKLFTKKLEQDKANE